MYLKRIYNIGSVHNILIYYTRILLNMIFALLKAREEIRVGKII